MKRYTEIITDHIYQASALPVNVFFCTFERIFGSVSFCEEMLADRVHLTTPAQRLVANFCFKWLENKDTAPPKPAKGESLLPLSTVLTAEKIIFKPRAFVSGESVASDDVFRSSASRALANIERMRITSNSNSSNRMNVDGDEADNSDAETQSLP